MTWPSGEGKYYLGTGTVTTSGGTPTSFSFTFDTVNGAYVTAYFDWPWFN